MNRMRQFMAIALISLYALPAYGEECVSRESGLSDFGVADLGATQSELGTRIRRTGTECDLYCEYIDHNGVNYGVNGALVLKYIDHIQNKTAAQLPFGLTPRDNLASALKKLRAVRGSTPLTMRLEPGGLVVFSDLCLRNRRGKYFSFDMYFDKNDRPTFLQAGTASASD